MPPREPIEIRLVRKISRTDTGCWEWTGATAGRGYGVIGTGGRKKLGEKMMDYTHRVSYEFFVGPIFDGHEIDHLCENILCLCPEHLEQVTPAENKRRVAERRTHCQRGHEFVGYNVAWNNRGDRYCRACDLMRQKRRRFRVAVS